MNIETSHPRSARNSSAEKRASHCNSRSAAASRRRKLSVWRDWECGVDRLFRPEYRQSHKAIRQRQKSLYSKFDFKSMSAMWDESECYNLNVWVETNKSLEEFERSLASVIDPLGILNHQFSLGEINCTIHVISDGQPPSFPGIPVVKYAFRIDVPVTPWNFWAHFDRILAFSIASGLRSKFSCRYLVTANLDFFAFFSGTNMPCYFNDCYSPLISGEVFGFSLSSSDRCHRVSIPKAE